MAIVEHIEEEVKSGKIFIHIGKRDSRGSKKRLIMLKVAITIEKRIQKI